MLLPPPVLSRGYRVERVIRHPGYDAGSTDNDIALLRLSRDVEFSGSVQPACLPTQPANAYAGRQAAVSGWGTTAEGGETSDVLKETTVTILDQADGRCVRGAHTGPLWSTPGRVPYSKLCAYSPGTDSCQVRLLRTAILHLC